MRAAFIDGLIDMARTDDRVALVVGDLGYSVVEPFAEEFPDRFFNAGIAEQSMMGMAAGLASEGLRVFVYSIANFPTFRCAEQIRNDVAYHGLPVVTVAVGGGLVYGNMGYSHHAIQDYALMRSMPGMMILAPGDSAEVVSCLKIAASSSGPAYLRLGNPGTPNVHQHEPELVAGELLQVSGSRQADKVILTTGGTLALAQSWLQTPKYEEFAHYSLPCWGMDYRQILVEELAGFETVVSVEDHLLDGGFGSWILETFSSLDKSQLGKLHIKALSPDVVNHVAKEEALRTLGGLLP